MTTIDCAFTYYIAINIGLEAVNSIGLGILGLGIFGPMNVKSYFTS